RMVLDGRYNVTKLITVFVTKQLATTYPPISSNVVVNCMDADKVFQPIVECLVGKVGRSAVVGARALVHGVSAGASSHRGYVPDCKITKTKGLAIGEKGAELKRRVGEELRQKWEAIYPGV
ncbi:hypothetical protein BJ878DRAFT_391496, partial [Calycina marina]